MRRIATLALAAASLAAEPALASHQNGLRRSDDERGRAPPILQSVDDTAVDFEGGRSLYHGAQDEYCMEQASGINLGCTAQDIKFHQVTGFDILDGPILQPCNCTTSTTTGCNPYDIDCGIHPPGTVFGACPGGNNNDYVKIQMNVDFLVSTTRYDVGMYVALDGGSALNGDSCQISSLVHGTFGDVTVWDVEGDASRPNPAPDNCLDLGSPGVMESYPFSPMIMSCTDSNGDGLLDFDIGIVWSVKRGDYDCDIDNLDKRPVASSSPKCWYDENVRATIPIYVPDPPPPPPPIEARDDYGETPMNVPITIDVLENDLGTDPLIMNTVVTEPLHGTATETSTEGFVEYQPNSGFTGTDSFVYEMCDASTQCDTATVYIEVLALPLAIDDSATTAMNQDVIITVIPNDMHDGSVSKVESITQPDDPTDGIVHSGGTLAYNQVVYQPTDGFVGRTAFTYTICQDSDDKCDEATVTVDVIPPPPEAVDDYATTLMNTPISIPILQNDTSVVPLVVGGITSQPAMGGTVSAGGTLGGSAVYYPPHDFVGTDTFTYEACDEWDQCDEALVTVVVDSISIEAMNDYAATPQGTPVVISVLSNDLGTNLQVQDIPTDPSNGVATIASDSLTVTYTPNPGFFGRDSFVYEMCKASDTTICDTATVIVDVIAAVDDAAETPFETPVIIDVLPNDEGNNLYVNELPTGPSNGVAEIQPDGKVKYTPNDMFAGQDSFIYKACVDNTNVCEDCVCDTATVTIDVILAVKNCAHTPTGTPVIIPVLPNDHGYNLTLREVPVEPSNGEIAIQPDGTIKYTPDLGFEGGLDTFEYTACIGDSGVCDTAIVEVHIISAVDDNAETPKETPIWINVLDNDLGQDLFVKDFPALPPNGEVDISGKGVLYTPDPGFSGDSDVFVYTACETEDPSVCDTATVTVLVPNRPPVADPDVITINMDTVANIPVLDNDDDPDNDPLIVTELTDPDNGTSEIETNDRVVEYTPDPGFTGVDTFDYQTCDPHNLCDSAQVTVIVNPIANNDLVQSQEGVTVTHDVLENDLGLDLVVTIVGPASRGTCSIANGGLTIRYTPEPGFILGSDECIYTACTKGTEACDTAKLIIVVHEAPTDMPSAMPSASPTEAWYYPDWIDDSQVCLNDFREPEYMLEVQRDNYLYRSKEDCCQQHFWWRIQQCMQNESPKYYDNGEYCEQDTYFEFWQYEYTPETAEDSGLYETLEECCVAHYWWDKDQCLSYSPREVKYYFRMDVAQLNEPEFCQDMDIIANAMVTAIETGLETDMRANVTSIGCATIIRDYDTGTPECGGCLAGQDFLGGTEDGFTIAEDATGVITPVEVEIRKKCYHSKTQEDIDMLSEQISTMMQNYISTGWLAVEMREWARERVPQVPQLFNADVVLDSFMFLRIENPFDFRDNQYYPDWIDLKTCVNDGLQSEFIQNNPGDYLFDSVGACCNKWFSQDLDCGKSDLWTGNN